MKRAAKRVNSCNKGKAFERAVALAFRAIYPDARRTSFSQARKPGEDPDIGGTGPFWVEAKNHKRVNIQKALAQAVSESGRYAERGAIPIAVTRDLRAKPLVTLRLTDFLAVLQQQVVSRQVWVSDTVAPTDRAGRAG